ncbi:MAG TPA: hypothetical protein VF476_09010 [Chitinophagaceae bacterium]
MRKVFFLLAAFAVFATAFASVSPEPKSSTPVLRADKIMIPLGKSGYLISLQDLSVIKLKTLESITGKKMNLFERLGFKAAQKKLRNNINPDGTINNKKLAKQMGKAADGSTGFHIGGFALGFLLGLIGILIAYLINDDNKRNRVKWAWLGLAAAIIFVLILAASGFAMI